MIFGAPIRISMFPVDPAYIPGIKWLEKRLLTRSKKNSVKQVKNLKRLKTPKKFYIFMR